MTISKLIKVALFSLIFLLVNPAQVSFAKETIPTGLTAAKDNDLVKEACKLYWNLSSPKSSSSKDMASWAKKNKAAIEKAVTKIAQAKKINKKWAPLELEMVTFLGALTLGSDPKYAFVFTQNKLVVDAQIYLVSVCKENR